MVSVVLLRWPSESARRERLGRLGQPRLLLLEDGVPAPTVDGCLEDWARLPLDEDDLRARLAAVEARSLRHVPGPRLDQDDVLHIGEESIPLAVIEARLVGALLERPGAVVPRQALSSAAWPDGERGRNALDVHVLRLRRRLAGTGLVIRTVRSRGYLLESAGGAGARAEPSASCQEPVNQP